MSMNSSAGRGILLAVAIGAQLSAAPVSAQAQTAQDVRRTVAMFAGDAIRTGAAVGVGIGVVHPGSPPASFSFGYADAAAQTPLAADTLFEIASLTKLFTTNLLGQAVARSELTLATNLAQLSAQVGPLKPLTGQVTLLELADFTGGLPFRIPVCSQQNVPGCTIVAYPTQTEYTAADFLNFFRNTVPTDYGVSPPAPLTALPGSDQYSDVSVGLLGLLLGTRTGPIGRQSMNAWYHQVSQHILKHLGMTNTYVVVPGTIPSSRIAYGYTPATATPVLSGGGVASITVTYQGTAYSAVPDVRIVGGGGNGATATATVANGGVQAIEVLASGENYVAAPQISFTAGKIATARATAIVAGQRIVGANVANGGNGYAAAPTVTITGGRSASGRDAQLIAHIAKGHVTGVTVVDGGAGYVTPLAVVLGPGDPQTNVVPVWGAAGGLVSSIADMTNFAAAAVGRTAVAGHSLPAAVRSGFQMAETEYDCVARGLTLATCGAGTNRVGLAWTIMPADAAHGVPLMVSKTGGVTGFTSQMVLVPDKQLAVVVLVNSTGAGQAKNLAFQIVYALLYGPHS